jgi:hypothetical protein
MDTKINCRISSSMQWLGVHFNLSLNSSFSKMGESLMRSCYSITIRLRHPYCYVVEGDFER